MTLQEAITEVQRVMTLGKPTETTSDAWDAVGEALVSGDLTPKTDAEQAVAAAYQRAADVVPQGWCAEETKHTEMDVVLGQAIQAAILALAPADALAEVQALKEALEHWIDEAFKQQRRAEAAEAEAARLREALEFYADLSHEGPWHLPSEDYGKRARAALEQNKTET